MAMREFLRLTYESSYGTFNGSPGSGEQFLITLPGPNSFTMRPVPMRYTIRDPGGLNRMRLVGSNQLSLSGRLMTVLHPSQAEKFLGICLNTSGTREELGSFTLDHAFVSEASPATILYKRYLGCKCAKGSLTASNEGENQKFMMSLDIVGSTPGTITVSDFATPAPSGMPSDLPYVFQNTGGNISIGSTRTQYRSVSIDWTNILDVLFDESQYASAIRFCGRDIGFSFTERLRTNSDRSTFEGTTAVTSSIELDNGTNSVTFAFGARTFFTAVDDDLQLSKAHYRTIKSAVFLDPSAASGAGTDLTLTFA